MNAQWQAWFIALMSYLSNAINSQTSSSPLPSPPPSYPIVSSSSTPTPQPSTSPTPTSTATPSYQLATAPTPYPQAINGLPNQTAVTVVAEVICNYNTTGATIISNTNVWALRAGRCDGSPSPLDRTGLEFDDLSNNLWVPATTTLGLTSGYKYFEAGVADGSQLWLYFCQVPGHNNCNIYSVADHHPLSTGSTIGYVGGYAASTQILSGSISNVAVYPFALSTLQIQALANAAI